MYSLRADTTEPQLAIRVAKLQKKLVKRKRFWKINANRFLETLAKARIRPEIKARGEE